MAQRSPSWSCRQLHAPPPPAAKGQPCNDWFVHSAKGALSGPNSGYLCRARGPLPFNLSSLGSHLHASICLLGEPDLHHLQLWQTHLFPSTPNSLPQRQCSLPPEPLLAFRPITPACLKLQSQIFSVAPTPPCLLVSTTHSVPHPFPRVWSQTQQ